MEIILSNKLGFTVGLIAIACILKLLIGRILKRKYKKKGVDKRYLVSNIRNAINLLLFILIILLWNNELQRFALSIAAFVVAIVLATKEIIQCFIGFIYLSTSAPFRIGDWVQINDTYGEVSEIDWAKTSLLEVDIKTYSYTGKTVFVPNSVLMLQSIKNLNYMRRYVNHFFDIVREDTGVLPINLVSQLYDKANEYCSDFKEVAERYNSLIESRLEVQISGPEPSIKISTTDIGNIKVSFSLFCPTEDAIKIEQKLTSDFFSIWHQCKL